MSTLLILGIAVLLLNYWLCLPVSDTTQRPAPSIGFSMGALFCTAPLTWLISTLLPHPPLAALRGIAAVLILGIAIQLALRFMLTRIELHEEAARRLRQRVLLNSSVFALALLHTTLLTDLGTVLLLGAATAVGFELALYVFTQQQARLARSPVPEPFRGTPITLISAGLMALALMGLRGLF
jgi:electron transport complex protein RnfA